MDLLRLEQQRQSLEQNLLQLRKSLKHWQTLDAEYEGLKEEILANPAQMDAVALENIASTYAADLVDATEIRQLTGLHSLGHDQNGSGSDKLRSPQQIVDLISHRQAYVQTNIDAIQRRFFDAEGKLEELDFVASREAEGGLPLTEIHEELDDDDNVISVQLEQPEAQQAQLVESLRKAGLTDDDLRLAKDDSLSKAPPFKSAITNASPVISTAATGDEKQILPSLDEDNVVSPVRLPIRKKSVSFTADTKPATVIVRTDSEDGKKTVSFAEKIAVAPAAPPSDSRSVSFSPMIEEIPAQPLGPPSPQLEASKTPGIAGSISPADIQKVLRASNKPGDKPVGEGKEDDAAAKNIVVPENESAEDAQLRREMIDYALNEVGHVVAQMDLDDDYGDDDDDASSHHTGSTYPDDENASYTSGFSDEGLDSEDDYGRSKNSVLTEEYRNEMEALQRKLIGNLGPAPNDEDIVATDPGIDPADVRRLVVQRYQDSLSSGNTDLVVDKKTNNKKRVSFAGNLEVEAAAAATVLEPPPSKAQKLEDSENVQPSAPAHTELLAETLVERPLLSTTTTLPPSQDAPDSIMQRRELASEYHKRRNNLIRQQGGFRMDADMDEEEEKGPLFEQTEDGRVKKVSRFKAARVKGI